MEYSGSTDHQTFNKNDLPQNPLHELANSNEINSRNSIKSTIFSINQTDSHHETCKHEKDGNYGLIKGKTSGAHVKTNDCLGRVVHYCGELLNFLTSVLKNSDLGESTDSLAEKMEDRSLFLKIKLLQLLNHLSSIGEEKDSDEQDDKGSNEEVQVDLDNIDNCNDDDRRTFQSVNQPKYHDVVYNSKVI